METDSVDSRDNTGSLPVLDIRGEDKGDADLLEDDGSVGDDGAWETRA